MRKIILILLVVSFVLATGTNISNLEFEIIFNQSESNTSVNEALDNDTIHLNNETSEHLISSILKLILDKISVIQGEVVQFTANLTSENHSPLADKKIDFYCERSEHLGQIPRPSGRLF